MTLTRRPLKGRVLDAHGQNEGYRPGESKAAESHSQDQQHRLAGEDRGTAPCGGGPADQGPDNDSGHEQQDHAASPARFGPSHARHGDREPRGVAAHEAQEQAVQSQESDRIHKARDGGERHRKRQMSPILARQGFLES